MNSRSTFYGQLQRFVTWHAVTSSPEKEIGTWTEMDNKGSRSRSVARYCQQPMLLEALKTKNGQALNWEEQMVIWPCSNNTDTERSRSDLSLLKR